MTAIQTCRIAHTRYACWLIAGILIAAIAHPGKATTSTSAVLNLAAEQNQKTRSFPVAQQENSVAALEEPSKAPSVAWLIVMPAIPIVGGLLIGVSRKLSGSKVLESRICAPPPCPSSEGDPLIEATRLDDSE